MIWEQEILFDYQSRRTTTIDMRGTTEGMKYREEGVHSTSVAVERTDKYYANDDCIDDKNDEDEGETEFEEDRNGDGMGTRY